MGLIKNILLKVAPVFYRDITLFIGKKLIKFRSNEPFITSCLGGDFKEFINNDANQKVINLFFCNLDKQSRQEAEVIFQRLLKIPNDKEINKGHLSLFNLSQKIYLGNEHLINSESILKDQILAKVKTLKKTYPFLHIEDSVAYFHHGLMLLPERVVSNLKAKRGSLIDVGAYHGDSAFFLSEYVDGIFSFDISENSIVRYRRNMTLLGISNYQIEKLAVTDTTGNELAVNDNGSAGLSLNRTNEGYSNYVVKTVTIDDYCKRNSIAPSILKADMEGSAYEFVVGSLGTIRTHRPILSIAIYHNPKEFFMIKPLLESEIKDYKFIVRKLSSETKMNECHSEVYLIGYPIEMDN